MASSLDRALHAAEVMPLILERLAAGQTVCGVGFSGRSMLPMLRQGKDSVELTAVPARMKKYDLPMYLGPSGKYVMHRIVAVKDDHYICLGDNTYAYERIKPEQIVAKVCAFQRGDKRISVENRWYRLYCRIWCASYPARRFMRRAKGWLRRLLK